jgi:hypothetical protein
VIASNHGFQINSPAYNELVCRQHQCTKNFICRKGIYNGPSSPTFFFKQLLAIPAHGIFDRNGDNQTTPLFQ